MHFLRPERSSHLHIGRSGHASLTVQPNETLALAAI